MPGPQEFKAREAAAAELDDDFENPSAVTDAGELLIPRELFPEGCKEGDVYTVKGTVGKIGSKVAFTPTEAFKHSEPGMGEENTAKKY